MMVMFVSENGYTDGEGSSGANFLKIGLGGRAAALGDTYCALANDATAPYWNPAGLSIIKTMKLQTGYTIWLEDINHEFIGYAHPLKKGVIGINLIGLQVDDIDERTDDTEEPISTFNATDLAVICSYGLKITPEISLGGGVRYINEKIKDNTANGLGVDMGVIYKPELLKDLILGISLTNIGITELNFIEEGDPLPTEVRIGGAYQLSPLPLNVGVDLSYPNDNDANIHIGVEYLLNPIFAIRLGYKSGPQDVGSGLSAGIGVTYQYLKFDYAYAPYGDDLGDTHRISVGINFSHATTTVKSSTKSYPPKEKAVKEKSKKSSQYGKEKVLLSSPLPEKHTVQQTTLTPTTEKGSTETTSSPLYWRGKTTVNNVIVWDNPPDGENEYRELTRLSKGTEIIVLDKNDRLSCYKIKFGDEGAIGWITSIFVE